MIIEPQRHKGKKLHEVFCILACLPTGKFMLLCVLCVFVVQCLIFKQPLSLFICKNGVNQLNFRYC